MDANGVSDNKNCLHLPVILPTCGYGTTFGYIERLNKQSENNVSATVALTGNGNDITAKEIMPEQRTGNLMPCRH
jgi:hypothetical protein